MGNESLSVLVGMSPEVFYTGRQRKLYEWGVKDAFLRPASKKHDRFVKPGGVEFIDDVMRVWVRPHIFVGEKTIDGKTLYPQPWFAELKWSDKTKLRDIVNALIDAGFPREWEYAENRSDRGPKRITRDDLEAALGRAGVAPR